MTYFDKLSKDEGYAAIIENSLEDMASSHAIKRFFKSLSFLVYANSLRIVLNKLFEWRLRIEKPAEVELALDTMVMDNDEAESRIELLGDYV